MGREEGEEAVQWMPNIARISKGTHSTINMAVKYSVGGCCPTKAVARGVRGKYCAIGECFREGCTTPAVKKGGMCYNINTR